jgi:hypothetical protein
MIFVTLLLLTVCSCITKILFYPLSNSSTSLLRHWITFVCCLLSSLRPTERLHFPGNSSSLVPPILFTAPSNALSGFKRGKRDTDATVTTVVYPVACSTVQQVTAFLEPSGSPDFFSTGQETDVVGWLEVRGIGSCL